MDKIKFLHTADLHLDSPFVGLKSLPQPIFNKIKNSTFESFDSIIQHAIDQQVDFVVIAGDVYDKDHRSVQAQTKLRKGFEILAEHDIDVFVSHGNHDHLGGDWLSINWPPNVHFFKDGNVQVLTFEKNQQTKVHIYGFSYPQRAVTENKTSEYRQVQGAQYHIGLLHGALEGNTEHDRYAPFTINELLDKNFNYWALGHIHQKQVLHEQPHIIYPGNIQGLHKGEKGEKGCYVVELHDHDTKVQFLQTNSIRWESQEIDIATCDHFEELLFACDKVKDACKQNNVSTILHLKLVGSGVLHQSLQDSSTIEELLEYLQEGEEEEDSFVWINSIEVGTANIYNREDLIEENGFIGELLRGPYIEEDLKHAVSTLIKNKKFKKAVSPFDEQDWKEIIMEAEKLLLYQLMKD